jgi:HTH-type transcriptional regulator/antitoxin MqsA
MKIMDQCQICGGSKLEHKEVTETFEYKGQSFEYPNYVVYACESCGEEIVDSKCLKESGRKIRDFYRKVDGLLTSDEIKRIRKFKLGLTQDEASKLIGGGPKSFCKYENCEVIQSEAVDNLLRVLDLYPHTLEVMKNKHNHKPASGKVVSMVVKTKQPHLETYNVTRNAAGL